MPAPPTAPGLAQTFALIIGGLCQAAKARFAVDRSIGPLLVLLCRRLQRMAARFAALAARAQAGPLSPPRPRPARKAPSRPRERPLPESFGWLVRLVGSEAACSGSQLMHLLSDPEMAALLKAAPQVGRILRPLCRMLAQKPDPTVLPPPLQRPTQKTAPPTPEPSRNEPPGTEKPGTEKPGPKSPAVVWRRWRGIRMPEPLRPPEPA